MLRSLINKVFSKASSEINSSPAVLAAVAEALRPFEGRLVFSSESAAGMDEIWEDQERVRRHFRGGALETVEWRNRSFAADSEQAKRWFGPATKPEDRKPFLLSRADSPYGADPESGVLQASETWAHPELGECTVFVAIDTRTGEEKRSDPRWLQQLKAEEERKAASGKVINPELERLRERVLAERAAGGAEQGKEGGKKKSPEIGAPDLNALREQVKSLRENEGKTEPQWRLPDLGL